MFYIKLHPYHWNGVQLNVYIRILNNCEDYSVTKLVWAINSCLLSSKIEWTHIVVKYRDPPLLVVIQSSTINHLETKWIVNSIWGKICSLGIADSTDYWTSRWKYFQKTQIVVLSNYSFKTNTEQYIQLIIDPHAFSLPIVSSIRKVRIKMNVSFSTDVQIRYLQTKSFICSFYHIRSRSIQIVPQFWVEISLTFSTLSGQFTNKPVGLLIWGRFRYFGFDGSLMKTGMLMQGWKIISLYTEFFFIFFKYDVPSINCNFTVVVT